MRKKWLDRNIPLTLFAYYFLVFRLRNRTDCFFLLWFKFNYPSWFEWFLCFRHSVDWTETHDWVLLRVFSFCCGTLSPRLCTMVLDSHTSRTFNADEIRSNFSGCLYSVRRTSIINELKKNLFSLLKHINFYVRNKIRCCFGLSRCVDFGFRWFWLVEKRKMQLEVIVHLKSTSISYHAKSQTETQTYNLFGRNVKS